MIHDQQMDLFKLVVKEREDIRQVLQELEHTCHACRLGAMLHPENKGLIWRGHPDAKIAIVSEMPGKVEMAQGVPLVGPSGRVFERWMTYLGLDTRMNVLITNVVQCQTETSIDPVTHKESQRAPKDDEIQACFGPRCLRILRAMPNLEVVFTMGWVAAEALLGRDAQGSPPRGKTHDRRWFRTSLLPGVAVYCMVHPSFIMRDPNPDKDNAAKVGLDMFRREYLQSRKPLEIVKQMEATDEEQAHE